MVHESDSRRSSDGKNRARLPKSARLQQPGRRRLLGALGLSGTAAALPEHWIRPVTEIVLLPAHAQLTMGGVTFTCTPGGPTIGSMGGTQTITLNINPPPVPATIPIQVIGICNAVTVFNFNLNVTFTLGQATLSVGPVNPTLCPAGSTLTVALTATGLGVSSNCQFAVV